MMKKLTMILVCLFAMMAASTDLKAQEISILLRPGWNWIGYPYPETVDLETAFGDFEPMADDVIESFWGYSEYVAGYGWFGGIEELKPGWGYMYYSNRTEVVTIVFSPSTPPVEPITVTTAEPTEITANSAVSGGSITSNDGNYVFVLEKGICWATHPNPMVMNDSFTQNGNGPDDFTAEMTDLTPNTVYYVRAFAVTVNGTIYGNQQSFTTEQMPNYTVTLSSNPTDGGMVTGGGMYEQGQSCTVSATANMGYTFINWKENGSVVSTNANYTFVVTDNRTLVANFVMESYTISVSASPSNGGSVYGGGSYNYGQSCTVHATTNAGYSFNNWTINGSIVSTNANYTFTVTSNRTLVANFTYNGGGNTPVGAINGLFSVSATRQVWFSQGNLQYQASTNVWRFADNQYDCIGNANSNISSTYSGWIDLFCWGTSGYNHGAVCYQPWSTSTTTSDYFAYGQSNYNLYDQTGEADWGYNPISNGGNQLNQWRTLTINEWNYIFNIRSTVSGIRYAKAQVNDINGLILLPDNWMESFFSLNNTNQNDAEFSSNTISIANWSILEQHGAVFLPAAGDRWGTLIWSLNSQGRYCSASANNTYDFVYYAVFSNSSLSPKNDGGLPCYDRNQGYSVRLVRNAQ